MGECDRDWVAMTKAVDVVAFALSNLNCMRAREIYDGFPLVMTFRKASEKKKTRNKLFASKTCQRLSKSDEIVFCLLIPSKHDTPVLWVIT